MPRPPEPYPPSGQPLPSGAVAPSSGQQQPLPGEVGPPTGQQPQPAPWGAGGPQGAQPQLWQQRPPRRGASVWLVLGILAAAVALVVSVSLIAATTGVGAAVTGGIVALIPLAAVLLAIRWIDRWEPEPRYALVFAFLWGAGVATLAALVINTLLTQTVYLSTGNVETTEFVGAAVIAPVVEETAKGLGILVIFLARRRYFTGPVDGIVYAAMVGAGFAFVENILYFGQTPEILPLVFVMRGIMSPFAHVLFAVAMGIALGLAARSRNRLAWLWMLPIGWVIAVGLHALWNGSALTGAFFGVYVLIQVPLFLGTIGLVLWLRSRERKVIEHRLIEYAQAGWFAPHEVAMLSSLPGRGGARRWAAQGGPAAKRAMRTFQRSATELAFVRQRMATGRSDLGHRHDEHRLLESVTGARATFLQGVTGVR